jgi:hypothetical protein
LGSVLAVGCSSDTSLDRKGGQMPDTSDGGSPAGGSGGEASLPIPSCVLEVVQSKCQRCHGDPLANGAPVPFLTVDDFQSRYFETDLKWWEVSVDRVRADVMPFVALNDLPNPPMPPVEPLTADEKATLLGWLERGALADDADACP